MKAALKFSYSTWFGIYVGLAIKWELTAVVEPMHFSSSVSLIESIFNADHLTYNLHVEFLKA
jgi:hypothetical protein